MNLRQIVFGIAIGSGLTLATLSHAQNWHSRHMRTPTSAPADTTAPTAPTGLAASAPTSSSLTLSWSASTDSVGVTGYRVYRDGTLVASPSGTSASITGLSAGVPYSFTVSAFDAAGNVSALSAPLSVTLRVLSALPQFLWTAGMEAGNMLEWYADGGGGEYNGNPGENPCTGTGLCDVTGSQSQATKEKAHSGVWSAKLSIPGAWGAVRLKRWKEAAANRELYYTAWYFVPQVYTVDQAAGGSTNWWQTKSTTATQNDPFFLIGWFNPSAGVMRQQLVWWGPATEGPAAGQNGQRTWNSPINVPIGRWFKHEVRLVNAGDFTGAIQVWQDGVEIFHLEGVKTRYPTGTLEWGLANYASSISPSPYYFYADDVAVSTTRIGP